MKGNGLVQQAEEVQTYVENQKVDVILISETHLF